MLFDLYDLLAKCRIKDYYYKKVTLMCGVSRKDRKRSEVLYSLLGIQSVTEVVRRGRLR